MPARYTVIIEFKPKSFLDQPKNWEEDCASIHEVAKFAPLIDDTVASARVIDNVTGKTVQKLR